MAREGYWLITVWHLHQYTLFVGNEGRGRVSSLHPCFSGKVVIKPLQKFIQMCGDRFLHCDFSRRPSWQALWNMSSRVLETGLAHEEIFFCFEFVILFKNGLPPPHAQTHFMHLTGRCNMCEPHTVTKQVCNRRNVLGKNGCDFLKYSPHDPPGFVLSTELKMSSALELVRISLLQRNCSCKSFVMT